LKNIQTALAQTQFNNVSLAYAFVMTIKGNKA